ncbi:uncharacterized protein LOC134805855 [Cydia splendana]|uniref:uncharacterized protein LOC134805855 n=1 Tax=Cydia splendana TaxID=1100963 RepID=UPI00300D773A
MCYGLELWGTAAEWHRVFVLQKRAENPDCLSSELFNCIKKEVDACFIQKKVQGKAKTKFSDWATPDIHEKRRRLYDLYDLKATDKRPEFLEFNTHTGDHDNKNMANLNGDNSVKMPPENDAETNAQPQADGLAPVLLPPTQQITVPVSLPPAQQNTAPASLPLSARPSAQLAGASTTQVNNTEAEFSQLTQASLFRIGIKVPAFWADNPAVWFAQLEAQFDLARITSDSTKFYHAMAQLEREIAAEVEDIIINPPKENKYLTLKTELIRRLSVSQQQKEKQLLMHEELGSRKPSQFLRHLIHLAGPTKLPENFIRTVWSSRLPLHLQTVVAQHPDIPLAKLSELADHIHEIASPSPRIAEVSPTAAQLQPHLPGATPSTLSAHNPYSTPHPTSPLETMSLQIAELTRQMAALTSHVYEVRSRSQTRSSRRSNSRSRSKSGARSQVRDDVRGRRSKTDFQLYAANGSIIATYGYAHLELDLGLRRCYRWRFIVADVTKAIIGVDFLSHYNLLVDCTNKRLIDCLTSLHSPAKPVPSSNTIASIKTIIGESKYYDILRDFPDVTRPAGTHRQLNHGTVHHIRTTPGPPVVSPPRRLAPDKLKIAKAEFQSMLESGTARPSESPWSSPLHLAPKKDNGWRPCGDYRMLNARTIPDCYPIRHIHDFTQNITGCKVFSTIDLVKAYNQIPVNEDDIPKTAITTPFGMYEFPFMTFGLRNAGQTFQRFVDEMTRGLDFCYTYLDDFLVYSTCHEEHEDHLRQLFSRLQQYGMVINTSKCVFGKSQVTFLGYSISADGIKPLETKVQAIKDYPVPKTVKELRRFLGMLNFYRRFIPHAAKLQAPLNAFLTGSVKGSHPVDISGDALIAFEDCKQSVCDAALLAHPDCNVELSLVTDASDTSIGAAIHQYKNGAWQPLAFFFAQINYSTTKIFSL